MLLPLLGVWLPVAGCGQPLHLASFSFAYLFSCLLFNLRFLPQWQSYTFVWRLWPLGVVRAELDPSLSVNSLKGPCTCNCSWNTLRQGLEMFWYIVLGRGRKLAGGETQMLSCELIAKGTRLQTKTTSLVSSCTRCVVLFLCWWLKWAKSGSSGRSQRAQTGVCSSWEQ